MKKANSSEYSFEHLARLNWANSQIFFLRSLSHDLKNPINSILLGSKLLHNLVEDLTDQFDELDEETGCLAGDFRKTGSQILSTMPQVIQGISDSAFRLDQFVSYLLEFTGEGPITTGYTMNIKQLATLCTSMIQSQICKFTKHFSLDIENDLPVLAGSAQQIVQVINNLLMNALRSLPDRSCGVVLSASFDRVTSQMQLCILDQGAGIHPDILPCIVEPFFTTWQEHGCMGLGLTVADQIIRNHGGELSIDSEPGKGTSVLVSLPLYDPHKTECKHA
jgi:signal transduction histidine kinase